MKSTDSDKRKKYMSAIYSKTWSQKRKQYGVVQYDKDLIDLLTNNRNEGKFLEVAIGDGDPYAKALDQMHCQVYGIDIAPSLVDEVNKYYPNIKATVGDAENLQFSNHFFDVVYCLRSTWYFPDLIKAISEMLRVLKKDGLLVFDVLNMNHSVHKKQKETNKFIYIAAKLTKNIIKLLLRPIVYYAIQDWSFRKPVDFVTPSDPSNINEYLKYREDIEYKLYGVNWDHSFTLKDLEKPIDLDQYDRLVYKIDKIN